GYMEGVNFGSVLIDGFVAATWTLKREPKAATLRVALLDRLPKRERVALEAEGARLLSFIAADVGPREVTVVEPPVSVVHPVPLCSPATAGIKPLSAAV